MNVADGPESPSKILSLHIFFLLLNVELIDLDLPLCVQLKLVIDRPCGVGKDLAVTNVR